MSFPALVGRFLGNAAVRLLSRFPVVVHLFLRSTLVVALVFWLTLAFWIVVRLARTAHKGEPLR